MLPLTGAAAEPGTSPALSELREDELSEKPLAGVSDSKPDPASGSPPTDASEETRELLDGGSGCRRTLASAAPLPFAPHDGGGIEPPPLPAAAAALTPDTVLATPLDPEPADVAAPVPARAAPPASAPTPAAAAEATATPALATSTPVEMRSPPVRAGAPPRTAANSFGICQHSIMKIRAAPITSKAVMLGCADVPTPCASVSQPFPRPRPA